MGKMLTIKRRVAKGKDRDKKYVEIEESAELVDNGDKTCYVRLSNGDVIKRKKCDVII